MLRFLIFILILSPGLCLAKNPVILISIDGFAYHYLDKFQPDNILSLVKGGTHAKGMMPIFPSKTFPNHLSMVTGLYPAKHGIVQNKFYHKELKQNYTLGAGKNNNKWLTAKPIWTLAEQQSVKSAIYFWPESETQIDGVLPSYFFPYKHNTPNEQRVNQIVNWLKLPEKSKPEFIVAYFSTVDSAGHDYGLDSPELAQAVTEIDHTIGQLIERVKRETASTPNIIIVSDHGMTTAGGKDTIEWRPLLSSFKNLNVVNGQTQLYVYENEKDDLIAVQKQLSKSPLAENFQVFINGNYPEHWHFNVKNDVVPDMIINALAPHTFVDERSHIGEATHGFDPIKTKGLSALFIANGPNIKANTVIESFENIHVFSLLEKLLALNKSTNVDADLAVLEHIVIE